MGCGCEIYGQQIVNPNSTNPVQTMPKPRPGPAAIYVVDVIEFSSAAVWTLTVMHKTKNETVWLAAGTFAGITASGVSSLHVTGLKAETHLQAAFGAGVTKGDIVRFSVKSVGMPG